MLSTAGIVKACKNHISAEEKKVHNHEEQTDLGGQKDKELRYAAKQAQNRHVDLRYADEEREQKKQASYKKWWQVERQQARSRNCGTTQRDGRRMYTGVFVHALTCVRRKWRSYKLGQRKVP